MSQLCLKSSRQGCDAARLSHTWLQPGVREPRIRPKPFKTVSKTPRQMVTRLKPGVNEKLTFEAKLFSFFTTTLAASPSFLISFFGSGKDVPRYRVPGVVDACEQQCERSRGSDEERQTDVPERDERQNEERQVGRSRKNDVKQPVLENGPVRCLSSNLTDCPEDVDDASGPH